jgi:hypothetical protein
MTKKIDTIYLHCSDSAFGEVRVIESWHRARGWKSIGYHYVILNGRPFKDVRYFDFLDGQIQPGHAFNDDPIFADNEVGNHVAGRNSTSVGVCLIGTTYFTGPQLMAARQVCVALVAKFGVRNIKGHYEDPSANKTCPNIPMDSFRLFLEDGITLPELQNSIHTHVQQLGL